MVFCLNFVIVYVKSYKYYNCLKNTNANCNTLCFAIKARLHLHSFLIPVTVNPMLNLTFKTLAGVF